jgi:penicillin-binding protein 1A
MFRAPVIDQDDLPPPPGARLPPVRPPRGMFFRRPAAARAFARAAKPRGRVPWRLLRWLFILAVWGLVAIGVLLVWFARDLPRPEDALDAVRRPSLTMRDQSGALVATYGDVVGDALRLSDMPPYLPAAAVSVEDRRFWTHWGIDPWGMARAFSVDLFSGHLRQGGSTITQQVAKNLFLTNARTFGRKVQELMLTIWLERHFSKAEILEIWLNRVYLGSGAWGMDAGAKLYFGVSARHVSLWQAAVLAGLPRAPSRFNPRTDPKAAAARGREVLQAMAEAGAITAAQAASAGKQINFAPHATGGGWFADWAAGQAEAVVPPGTDSVLRSTLDSRLQTTVEARLRAALDGPGVRANVHEGAVVVLDSATGAVRAMAGGRDYAQGAYNRATLARRQPGSSFKAFVWLNALEHGAHPDDLVLDGPLHIGNWSPVDFEPGWRGEVTLEQALALSLNTAAVRLEMQYGGPQAVAAVAHRLGVTGKLPDLPSLALGTGEVGLLDMAAAYAAFFNGGRAVTPHAILAATADGKPMPVPWVTPRQVMDPGLAGMMVRMMAAVVRRGGTGQGAAVPGRFVAGKTGTTQDNRDAWFIGGVDGRVIGVWVGNDDGTPMRGVMGGGLPSVIFRQIAGTLPR